MTYQSEILADGPLSYFRIDEPTATVGATTPDSGSLGGTGSVTNAAVFIGGQPPAGTMDGYSWKSPVPGSSTYITKAIPTYTATALNTYEIWWKRDVSAASQNISLMYYNGASRKTSVNITNTATGAWSVSYGSTLATIFSGTTASLADGNWHHIVFVNDGTAPRLYVDGVQVGSVTQSLSANASGTMRFGNDTGPMGGWIDEPAFYLKALTPTRVAAHYAAGTVPASTSISVQAPASTVNLSQVAPVVRAGRSLRAVVPVATVNISTVTPILRRPRRITVTPATVSIAGVAPILHTSKRLAVPAMAISLTAPAPVVIGRTNTKSTVVGTAKLTLNAVNPKASTIHTATYTPQADVGYYGPTNPTQSFGYPGREPIFFKFPVLVPQGRKITKAVLSWNVYAASEAVNYSAETITAQWDYTGAYNQNLPTTVYDNGSLPTSGSGDVVTLDVTEAVKNDLGNGFAVRPTSTGTVWMIMSENGTQVPTLKVTYEVPPDSSQVVTVPPMVVSAVMSQAGIRVGTKNTVVGAGSVAISAPVAQVRAARGINITAAAMNMNVQLPGGAARNPNFLVRPEVCELWVYSPNATQYIAVPSINKTGVMTMSVDGTSDNGIDLTTSKTVRVTGTMKMTAKVVGIYNREADRYATLVATTVTPGDVWLPLDDVSGNVARDLTFNPGSDGTQTNPRSFYMGNPQLRVDGPYLRKAVRFDGVDDFINLQYPAYMYFDDVTIEFSIRTTQQNGVLFTGGGTNLQLAGGNGSAPGGVPNLRAGDQAQVRLEGGKIVITSGAGTNFVNKTNAYIADGEWHHVVLSVPRNGNPTPGAWNITNPIFLMVDGQTVWKRFSQSVFINILPSSAMAAVSYGPDAQPIAVTEAVAGEMSNLIVRLPEGKVTSEALAKKLYYEWSESQIVKAEPITVSLGMVAPVKARGNSKRMLVLFGLQQGWYRDDNSGTYGQANTYYSVFAGYYINNTRALTYPFIPKASPDYGDLFEGVLPFELEDYVCYPVSIMTQVGASRIQRSAAGMEKDDLRDQMTGAILDDVTGLPRFMNINTDLREPIENFDAITAVNYPAVIPDTSYERKYNVDTYAEPKQDSYGLTIPQWQAARDALRDSILDAAGKGLNLWINEPWMAEHLGFIQGWDKHNVTDDYNTLPPIPLANYTAGYDQYAFVANYRGKDLNLLNMNPAANYTPEPSEKGIGRYKWPFQLNSKRKIVALEPGLTDIPGYEMGDKIQYAMADRWAAHADWTAYNLIDRMNGLRVGDYLTMDMADEEETVVGGWWSVGDPRHMVVSARPEGIVGKVISREQESYWGPYGAVVNNRYKDNAYTIIAERGSVVRGHTIRGRVFMEFMAPDTQVVKVAEDRVKNKWKGDTLDVSRWSFDSRRYSQIFVITVLDVEINRKGPGGDTYKVASTIETRYSDLESADLIYRPFISMNARGLRWLAATDSIPAGEARVFAPAMTVNVSTPAAKLVRTGGAVTKVVGPMRVDLDLRQPKNYRGADFSDKVLPMTIGITMVGIGKVVKARPMELSINAPTTVRVTGSGDRIYVYMDADTNVTLFMKED